MCKYYALREVGRDFQGTSLPYGYWRERKQPSNITESRFEVPFSSVSYESDMCFNSAVM